MKDADDGVRVALLKTLAARNAKDAISEVLAHAQDESADVRAAAISALRFLADAGNTADLVQLVKSAVDDKERRMAQLALLSLCSRTREASAEAIANGLQDADPEASVALLRAVARTGGAKALETVVGRLGSDQDAVHAEALRMLAGWPDGAALDHLLRIAKESDDLRDHVVALRGIARLAGPGEDRDADLETLATALEIAKRPDEKRLIVGTLGGVADAAALEPVVPFLKNDELADEAGLAIVSIAEQLPQEERAKARAALTQVTERVKTLSIRERARKLLEG
jgi:HEAT repeat protein